MMEETRESYGSTELRWLSDKSSAEDAQNNRTYHCVYAADDQSPALGAPTNSNLRPANRGQTLARYQRYAVLICIVSLVVSILLGVVGFMESVANDNDAAFSFALNCTLDFFSTLVVLWRFWPRSSAQQNFNADNTHQTSAGFLPDGESSRVWWVRERRATIGIAVLFILAFVAVVCKALADIINKQIPHSALPALILAGVSCAVFLSLAWLKVKVASVLQSPAMRSDGVNSLAGTIISLGVIIGWLVTRSHPHVWYVNSFVGLLVGLGMFIYAIRVLVSIMSPEARTRYRQ